MSCCLDERSSQGVVNPSAPGLAGGECKRPQSGRLSVRSHAAGGSGLSGGGADVLWLLWLKMAIAFSSCCLSEPKFCSKHRRTSLFTRLARRSAICDITSWLALAWPLCGWPGRSSARLPAALTASRIACRRCPGRGGPGSEPAGFCGIWRMEPSERCRPFSITCAYAVARARRIAAGVVAGELELSQLLVFFAGEGRFSQRCASWTRFLPNSSEIDMRGLLCDGRAVREVSWRGFGTAVPSSGGLRVLPVSPRGRRQRRPTGVLKAVLNFTANCRGWPVVHAVSWDRAWSQAYGQ